MIEYTLLVLHKLEHTFGYYDVFSGKKLAVFPTREYPHEICLDPERNYIYIAEMGVRGIESEGPGGHTVAVFELKTGRQINTIDTTPYDRPHGIATDMKRLYVTSESTKHLLAYQLNNNQLLKAVHLDQECAHMLAVDPTGSFVYTANIWSNTVTAVETASLSVSHHIPVPERPEGMVFSPDGMYIYCVCREAACVAVIDCRAGEMVNQIRTGEGPVRVVITPDGKKLAIPLFHSAAIQIADTETMRVTNTIAVGPHPAGTCRSPDGRFVFMSCEDENRVYVFDMKTLKIIQEIDTGDGADAMVCLYASEIDGSLKTT